MPEKTQRSVHLFMEQMEVLPLTMSMDRFMILKHTIFREHPKKSSSPEKTTGEEKLL